MKLIQKEIMKLKNKASIMLSWGWGRYGPYVYAGYKNHKGDYAGTSIGTRGRQLYVGNSSKYGNARIRYNYDLKELKPRYNRYDQKQKSRRKK